MPEANKHSQHAERISSDLRVLKLDHIAVQTARFAVREGSIAISVTELYKLRPPEFEDFAIRQACALQKFGNLNDNLRPGDTRISYCHRIRGKAIDLPEQELVACRGRDDILRKEQVVFFGGDTQVFSSNVDTYRVAPEVALEVAWLTGRI